MTIVVIGGSQEYPPVISRQGFGPSFGSMTLDAADEAAAFIFQIPKDGTCIGATIRTGTVATGATVVVSLQTVSVANGDPTGTLYHANATVNLAIGDGDDNVLHSVTWTGFTVTQGDLVALVTTAPASGIFDIDISTFSGSGIGSDWPYNDLFTGTWAKSGASGIGALEYSGGVYYAIHGLIPVESISSFNFGNASTPDEHALKIIAPVGLRVVGWHATLEFDGLCDVILRDSGDTVLATTSLDPDQRFRVDPRFTRGMFDTEVELTKDSTYRLCFLPTTSTSIRVYNMPPGSVALLGASFGGSSITRSSRVDAGSWTDVSDEQLLAGLLFDGIDVPAGGGSPSGVRNPFAGPIG